MGSELTPVVLNQASNEIRRQFLSAFRARTELSWAPLFNLEEGLERTISWYREFLATNPISPGPNSRPGGRVLCRRLSRRRDFVPGSTKVPVSGKVFDAAEMRSLVDSALDFWLTTGRFADQFEREFARWSGLRDCLLVNSGSSANLLAVSALTSPKLGDRRLVPGDEVITVAAGFPTTVNPDPAKRLGAGVRRCDAADLQRRRQPARSGPQRAHTSHDPGPHAGQSIRSRGGYGIRAQSTICGSSRTAATPSAPPIRDAKWAPSAIWRPPAFIPRTTSPWAKAARC